MCVRPGSNFKDAIHPSLKTKYCSFYSVKGLECTHPNCRRKHLPMFKWEKAEIDLQIDHVEANRSNVLFADNVQFLPDAKKYLKVNGKW